MTAEVVKLAYIGLRLSHEDWIVVKR